MRIKRNNAFLFKPIKESARAKRICDHIDVPVPMAKGVYDEVIDNWSDYSLVEFARIWGLPLKGDEIEDWQNGACEEMEDFLGDLFGVFLDLVFNDEGENGKKCREALKAVGEEMNSRKRPYLKDFYYYRTDSLAVPGSLSYPGWLFLSDRKREFDAFKKENGLEEDKEAGRHWLEENA